MNTAEHSLLNLANYGNIRSIRRLLKRINELQRMAAVNQSAMCIWIDLKEAMKKAPTKRQQFCLILYYVCKETQQDIADELGLSKQSIEAYLRGGERRIQRYLLNGFLYRRDSYYEAKEKVI